MGEESVLGRLAAHFQTKNSKPIPLPPTEPYHREGLNSSHQKIENQPLYFSDQVIESAYFDRDDPQNRFLKPDLASIKLSGEKALGSGTGFTVYEANSPSGNKVVKVEKVVVRQDAETGAWSTHYPWMELGVGQERPPLHTPEDAVKRREIHLEVKKRLEAVGIETANYVGSVIVPSKPLVASEGREDKAQASSNTSNDDAAVEAALRMGKVLAAGQPPMYAEIWENPGGKMLGLSEKTVEDLYQTQAGRDALTKLANSIAALSQQGYLYDVDTTCYSTYVAPRTENGYPYPRNFMVINADKPEEMRLVAIDFNLGVDLTKQPWWKPEFSQLPVIRRSSNGQLYPNWDLQKAVEESASEKYTRLSFEEQRQLSSEDRAKEKRINRDRNIMVSQADHFIAQISVASSILSKIEEIEKRQITPDTGKSVLKHTK